MAPAITTEPALTLPVLDRFGRPLRSLRVSVTDRCNLRCAYCMPEPQYAWLKREEILHFEEIAELVEIFSQLGVDNVRLTGGEPLLRHGLARLIRMLAANERLRELSLTTNGLLLAGQAQSLRDAGLTRVTVSLDTLRPDRFRSLAHRDGLPEVLAGIAAARRAGFAHLKLNTVIMRGFNEDELGALLELGRDLGAEVRFIEYMDVGGATRWSMEQVFSRDEMLASLERRYGAIERLAPEEVSAPATRFRLRDGTTFGIISSTTHPFCRACDRARLTPDGLWLLCLYARDGVNLKATLRSGAGRDQIAATIAQAWSARRDRGAEERQALHARGVLFPVEDLRRNPHLEMHTRGG